MRTRCTFSIPTDPRRPRVNELSALSVDPPSSMSCSALIGSFVLLVKLHDWSGKARRARGAGGSQPCNSEDKGVEFLVIPEPGEVQAQWRSGRFRAVGGRIDQPPCAPRHRLGDLTLVTVCEGTTKGRQHDARFLN